MKRRLAAIAVSAALISGGGLVATGTVGFYNGLNKGITWLGTAPNGETVGCGFEIVGDFGPFCDAPSSDVYVPCAEEDSAGPCFWDATKRGNGYGQSFYVDSLQVVHY